MLKSVEPRSSADTGEAKYRVPSYAIVVVKQKRLFRYWLLPKIPE